MKNGSNFQILYKLKVENVLDMKKNIPSKLTGH